MSFELTEKQIAMQQSARKIAKEKIAPRASEIDATNEMPQDIVDALREAGLLGITVPIKYGGQGGGLTTICLVIEEIAKASTPCGCLVYSDSASYMILKLGGTEEQRKKYLARLVPARGAMTVGLTEPSCGSDLASMRSRAVRKDGYYLLNGQKCFISVALPPELYMIAAKTDPSKGARGISLFIAEKDTPGLRTGRVEDKLGIHGLRQFEFFFEDVKVPEENMVGPEGGGFGILMGLLTHLRLLYGTLGLAIAQSAFDYILNYVKGTTVLGQPLAEVQAVQALIAQRSIEIEASRSLFRRATAMVDRDEEPGILAAMAKDFGVETATRVTNSAMQILGNEGWMGKHPIERMMRDVPGIRIGEGTTQIQRMIIARQLLGLR